jgi:hypothetical protein
VYEYLCCKIWSDYQLSFSFPIAMTVAPDMIDVQHGIGALKLADNVLRAPLGMRPLDPSGLQYRPVYDNSNDSTDAVIAKGLNYHQKLESGVQIYIGSLRSTINRGVERIQCGATRGDSNVSSILQYKRTRLLQQYCASNFPNKRDLQPINTATI